MIITITKIPRTEINALCVLQGTFICWTIIPAKDQRVGGEALHKPAYVYPAVISVFLPYEEPAVVMLCKENGDALKYILSWLIYNVL